MQVDCLRLRTDTQPPYSPAVWLGLLTSIFDEVENSGEVFFSYLAPVLDLCDSNESSDLQCIA
jgi:hypothetical protein